jgi:hypothetical protein
MTTRELLEFTAELLVFLALIVGIVAVVLVAGAGMGA